MIKEKLRFFECSHCKNRIHMIHDVGVPIMCCGQPMTELVPNTTDAALEKHVPVVSREGDILTVEVGSVTHPMLDEHFIEWIYVETENSFFFRSLSPNEAPSAKFHVGSEAVTKVYAYCNLHGLWAAAL